MPQHDDSIRSALCIDNDPSLIGRAERIPFHCGLVLCLSLLCRSMTITAKVKGGSKGGNFTFAFRFAWGPACPYDLHALTKPDRTEKKEKRWYRRSRWGVGSKNACIVAFL